ncbi:arogenate dehydratase/prephenate dehydratase 6, chloroplastic-like [Ananas comosus]|uniref:Arogenate dehydratase n=1 Tax=Ananas comosus TaxID=4615 RepID=A0A6P5FSQ6_ANACO|nr:arogenate dehydratase/prephenate dehydratase 6, chloroplastic-like [Ananas comosus]
MALKAVASWVGGIRHVGRGDLERRRSAAPNWRCVAAGRRGGGGGGGGAEGFGSGVWVESVGDENLLPSSSVEVERRLGGGDAVDKPRVGSRDLSSLPKPLSLTDLSVSSHGSDVRVAYQGSPGAFSEAAALKAYPQCVAVPCEQFEVAFKAVELWLVDKAVLPIENSIIGSIHRNYDLLLCHKLHIVGEVQLAVDLCLMALPGVRREQLVRVLSHPQAFAQCENAITKLRVIRESYDDTAGAAELVASKGLRDAGAIASARAAELYGLNILENKMQDMSSNITRFLILAREPILPRMDRPFKTSIVFTLEEGPGVLFKALAVFALRSINLTKIESRPRRNGPLRLVDDSNHGTAKYFDYLFYIDFEASMAEPRAQNALAHLQEFATLLRVLGSYPMDTSL